MVVYEKEKRKRERKKKMEFYVSFQRGENVLLNLYETFHERTDLFLSKQSENHSCVLQKFHRNF